MRQQRAMGARVLILEPAATGGLAAHVRMEREVLAAEGVELIDAPVRIGPNPALEDLRTIRTLRDLLRREAGPSARTPLTAIHAHGLRAGALAALARGRRRGTSTSSGSPRLVVTLHNRIAGSPVSRLIGRLLLEVIVRRADVVLAVSPDLARAAARAPEVAHAVIPAPPRGAGIAASSSVGVVTSETSERMAQGGFDPDAGSSPTSTGLGAVPLQILAVGRLAPQKGFDVLAHAVGILQGSGVAVQARIAGEGPLEDQLRRQIQKHALPIALLGRREDIPALLAEADVVVSAARWEGQPVFLQEALAAGAAIVATDAGGTRLVTGDAAILVTPEDPRALAEAIRRLGDPVVREQARTHALRRAAQLPTREDLLAQLRSVLALEGPHPRP